jgi:hypothetical protein
MPERARVTPALWLAEAPGEEVLPALAIAAMGGVRAGPLLGG